MNVYFFSRHNPTQEMVSVLGGSITEQFKGTISAIKRVGENIEFLEVPLGGTEPKRHIIPAESIVVAVAPLALQEAWLKAGVSVFLSPQNRRETTQTGEVIFTYAGLLRILKIEVVSEQWAGTTPTMKEKHAERSAM